MFSPSLLPDSLQSYGLYPARPLCPWGLSRQEYWSGLPCPPPEDPPNPGMEPRSPTLQADSLPSEPPGEPKLMHRFSSVQSLSRVRIFATPWTAAHQASLSFTNSQSFLKLMSIELMMTSNHLIFSCPFFSCPQSLPASRPFPMSQVFASGGQSIGVSASALFLPRNTQD